MVFADNLPSSVWNISLGLFAILLGGLLYVLLRSLLKARVAGEAKFSLFRAAVRHFNKTVAVLLPLIFFNAAIPFMRLSLAGEATMTRVTELLLLVCFAVLLIRVVRIAEDYFSYHFDYSGPDNLKARKARTQIQFIRKLIVSLIVIVAFALVLLSFESMRKIGTGLLTGVGLSGIVIGFAAQKSLGNLLAGFQIAFTQPIRIDDVLVVEGEWGRIEEITLTYVVLNIWDKRRLILPIQYFIEKPFQNWTRTSAEILGTVFIHTDFSVPIHELRKEHTRLLKENPLWDGKVDVVQVTEVKEQTMEIRTLVSCRNSGDAWDLRCYIREKLMDFVRENYPQSLSRTRVLIEDSRAVSGRETIGV